MSASANENDLNSAEIIAIPVTPRTLEEKTATTIGCEDSHGVDGPLGTPQRPSTFRWANFILPVSTPTVGGN